MIQLKKIRRFFILCSLQYCCNVEQPLPIHSIVADVVQMCGCSTVLLTLLYQLGVTTSYKTYDRFESNLLKSKSVWDNLSPHLFTVVSVDNFDMLQSHAALYCGDRSRSYHGTTVQMVQPHPSLRTACVYSPSFSQTLDPAAAVDCTLSCDFDIQESPLVSVNVLPEVVNEVCLPSNTELGGTRHSCSIKPQSSPHPGKNWSQKNKNDFITTPNFSTIFYFPSNSPFTSTFTW